ncbi:MAG TPA: hypothetical protein VFS31_03450 [Chitinophagaceae bacterium]|nr:hypothetical protein [Chitinophagaceae bacterium]
MKKSEIFLLLGVVLAGIIVVLGGQFADSAKTPFWWKFWPVLQVICFVALIGGWLFLKYREKQAIDKERKS